MPFLEQVYLYVLLKIKPVLIVPAFRFEFILFFIQSLRQSRLH